MSEDLKRLDGIKQDGLIQSLKDIEHYKSGEDIHLERVIADVEWLIEQAEKTQHYKKHYNEATNKKGEYWQYKIAFEKLVEVLNK